MGQMIFQPLDILLFRNTRINPVSGLIELFTTRKGEEGFSHTAICISSTRAFECTLTKGCNGCRELAIEDLLAEYGSGSQVWLARPTPETLAVVDWAKFSVACTEMIGAVCYSVADLFQFFLPAAVEVVNPDSKASMVCSMAVTKVFVQCCAYMRGVQYERMSPADIATWADPARIGGALLMPGQRIK